MARVVVFGVGQIAEVAWFYLTHDSEHDVVAFTVDAAYRDLDRFHDLPVVDFETVHEQFPPDEHELFVSISYQQINRLREQKYHEAKDKGYRLVTYVSSRATVWPGAEIGDNCFIFEDNTIQPFARIGANVVMWSGNHLGHHSTIADHCFIASHVVISGSVAVGERTFMGVNATIRDNIEIGADSVIGMGAVITRSTADRAVVVAPRSRTLDVTSDALDGI